MKSFLFVALAAFAVNASAAPMYCGGSDKTEYQVSVAPDQKTAEVTRNGDPLQFGQLECSVPESAFANGPFLVCQSPHVADAGYTVEFSYVQRSLIIRAKVNQISFFGTKQIADLRCVAAMDTARETVSSLDEEKNLVVKNEKAKNIMQALKDVGVLPEQGFEASYIGAHSLKVEYTPRGFVYAQGTLVDNSNGKTLLPVTDNAFRLYAALKDAGVPSLELESFIGTSIVTVRSVHCASGYITGAPPFVQQCTITLP